MDKSGITRLTFKTRKAAEETNSLLRVRGKLQPVWKNWNWREVRTLDIHLGKMTLRRARSYLQQKDTETGLGPAAGAVGAVYLAISKFTGFGNAIVCLLSLTPHPY